MSAPCQMHTIRRMPVSVNLILKKSEPTDSHIRTVEIGDKMSRKIGKSQSKRLAARATNPKIGGRSFVRNGKSAEERSKKVNKR